MVSELILQALDLSISGRDLPAKSVLKFLDFVLVHIFHVFRALGVFIDFLAQVVAVLGQLADLLCEFWRMEVERWIEEKRDWVNR